MTLKERIYEYLEVNGQEEIDSWKDTKYLCKEDTVNSFLNLCKDSVKIIILGDYDVDGIHASFIGETSLKEIFPDKEIEVLIPKRSEGYGLNQRLEEYCVEALDEGPVTVITVDTGITAKERLERIRRAGATVILTDHHKLGDISLLPDVDMVIDPAVEELDCPFGNENRNLCGAGVIFKLLEGKLSESTRERLAIYAGIATVADVISLRGISWQIVRNALNYLHEGKADVAITKLCGKLKRDIDHITESDFGYYLSPAINAPGRIYNSEEFDNIMDYARDQATENLQFIEICPSKIREFKNESLEIEGAMLLLKYYDNPTDERASLLKYINEYRKYLVAKESQIIIDSIHELHKENNNPIWAYAPGLHKGIVGIIASTVEEEFHTSACILTDSGDGNYSGSGRAYGDFNMYDYLNSHSEEFVKFGGHPGAAGFSLSEENYHHMENFVTDKSTIVVTKKDPIRIKSEFIPYIEYITTPLRPFGEGFEEPEYELQITADQMQNKSTYMGAEQNHLAIKDVNERGTKYKMLHFYHVPNNLRNEDEFKAVGEIHMSYFNYKGTVYTTPEMMINEIEDLDNEELER